jgi:hypothetical protein
VLFYYSLMMDRARSETCWSVFNIFWTVIVFKVNYDLHIVCISWLIKWMFYEVCHKVYHKVCHKVYHKLCHKVYHKVCHKVYHKVCHKVYHKVRHKVYHKVYHKVCHKVYLHTIFINYTWVISKILHTYFLFKNEFILQNTYLDSERNPHFYLMFYKIFLSYLLAILFNYFRISPLCGRGLLLQTFRYRLHI